MKIFKYPLPEPWDLRFELIMPVGARLLALQIQHGVPTLWAEVNPDASAARCDRRFEWCPTGGDVPVGGGQYVGTLQWRNGALVYHLYDLGEGETQS